MLCKYKGVEIVEGYMITEHVHLLVSIPPKMSMSSFMGYLKGKTALMMFDRHSNLKYKFGNRHFGAEGYNGPNDPNAKEIGSFIADTLDLTLDGIFDSGGLASNGFIRFWQNIINIFKKIIAFFKILVNNASDGNSCYGIDVLL